MLNAFGFEPAGRWLRAFLTQHQISIVSGSALHISLNSIQKLMEFYRGAAELPPAEAVTVVRQACASAYLIKALHRAHPFLESTLERRLRIFRGSELSFFEAIPRSSHRDDAWELLTAAWAAPFVQNLLMQEPEDVSFDFGSRRWGLSCKVLYSDKVSSQIDALVKGAQQLEDANVDVGFVVANASNLLAHSRFCRSTNDGIWGYRHADDAKLEIARQLDAIIARLNTNRLKQRLGKSRQGRPRTKARVFMLFAGTIAAVDRRPMSLSCVRSIQPWMIETGESELYRLLNESISQTYAHAVTMN